MLVLDKEVCDVSEPTIVSTWGLRVEMDIGPRQLMVSTQSRGTETRQGFRDASQEKKPKLGFRGGNQHRNTYFTTTEVLEIISTCFPVATH